MVTAEDIMKALMEHSPRGRRAVGRALVLLYCKRLGGQHAHPLGVNMAEYFLSHGALTEKQLKYWRSPMKDTRPRICQHITELLLLAELKEKRKIQQINRAQKGSIKTLNRRNDLLEAVQDVMRASEPELTRAALLELRKFERQHGMTPATIQGIGELDADINFELDFKDPEYLETIERKATDYRNQSNGA